MNSTETVQSTAKASSGETSALLFQRKCSCGEASSFSGRCEECRRKKLLGTPLQRQLVVNASGDAYEQEADRMAEQVMRTPEGPIDDDAALSQPEPLVQRRVNDVGATGIGTAPPIVHEVLASPGRPLDATTRTFFESRFGYDFGNVRVHSDTKAAESAQAVNALAYTLGRDVVFGTGQYALQTSTGQRLLAHELAHVMQGTNRIQRFPGHGNDFAVETDETVDQIVKSDDIAWEAPSPYEVFLSEAVYDRMTEKFSVDQVYPYLLFLEGEWPFDLGAFYDILSRHATLVDMSEADFGLLQPLMLSKIEFYALRSMVALEDFLRFYDLHSRFLDPDGNFVEPRSLKDYKRTLSKSAERSEFGDAQQAIDSFRARILAYVEPSHELLMQLSRGSVMTASGPISSFHAALFGLYIQTENPMLDSSGGVMDTLALALEEYAGYDDAAQMANLLRKGFRKAYIKGVRGDPALAMIAQAYADRMGNTRPQPIRYPFMFIRPETVAFANVMFSYPIFDLSTTLNAMPPEAIAVRANSLGAFIDLLKNATDPSGIYTVVKHFEGSAIDRTALYRNFLGIEPEWLDVAYQHRYILKDSGTYRYPLEPPDLSMSQAQWDLVTKLEEARSRRYVTELTTGLLGMGASIAAGILATFLSGGNPVVAALVASATSAAFGALEISAAAEHVTITSAAHTAQKTHGLPFGSKELADFALEEFERTRQAAISSTLIAAATGGIGGPALGPGSHWISRGLVSMGMGGFDGLASALSDPRVMDEDFLRDRVVLAGGDAAAAPSAFKEVTYQVLVSSLFGGVTHGVIEGINLRITGNGSEPPTVSSKGTDISSTQLDIHVDAAGDLGVVGQGIEWSHEAVVDLELTLRRAHQGAWTTDLPPSAPILDPLVGGTDLPPIPVDPSLLGINPEYPGYQRPIYQSPVVATGFEPSTPRSSAAVPLPSVLASTALVKETVPSGGQLHRPAEQASLSRKATVVAGEATSRPETPAAPHHAKQDPIGDIAERGIGLPQRPDPALVDKALVAVRGGNATPEQQRVLLSEIVAVVRQFLQIARIADKKSPDAPFWLQMSGACGLGRDCSAAVINSLARDIADPIGIDRFQANAAFGFGSHAFLVVTFSDGSRYLVDPTFVQFLGKSGERIRRGSPNIRGAFEGNLRAEELATTLARDGIMPLNEETAAFYVRSMAATVNRKVDASTLPDLTRRLLQGTGTEASERIGTGQPGVAFEPFPDRPQMESIETLLELAEETRLDLKSQVKALEDPAAKAAMEHHILLLEQLINRIEDRRRIEGTGGPDVGPGVGRPKPLTRAELEAQVEESSRKPNEATTRQERADEAAWVDTHPKAIQQGEGPARAKIGDKGEHEIVAISDTGCKRHSPGTPIETPCPLIIRARIAIQAASIQAELNPNQQSQVDKIQGVIWGMPHLSDQPDMEGQFEGILASFEKHWAGGEDEALLLNKLDTHVLGRRDIDLEEEWDELKIGSHQWSEYSYEDILYHARENDIGAARSLLASIYRLAYDIHRTQIVDQMNVFANVRPKGQVVVFDARTNRLSITTRDGEFDAFFKADESLDYYYRDLDGHGGESIPRESRPDSFYAASHRTEAEENFQTDQTSAETVEVTKEGAPSSSETPKDPRSNEQTGDSLEETDLKLDGGHRIRLRNNKMERCSDCGPIAQAYHPTLHHPEARKLYDKLMSLQAAFDNPDARNPSRRQINSVIKKLEKFASTRTDVAEVSSENSSAVKKALNDSDHKSDLHQLIPALTPDEFSLLAKVEGYLSNTEWRNLSTVLTATPRVASASNIIITEWKTSLNTRTRLLEDKWRVTDAGIVTPQWLLDDIRRIDQTVTDPLSSADDLLGAESTYKRTLDRLPQLNDGYPVVVQHGPDDKQVIAVYDEAVKYELASDTVKGGNKIGLAQLRIRIKANVEKEFGSAAYNENFIPALVNGKFLKPAVQQPLVFYATEGMDPESKFTRELTGDKAPGDYARTMTARPSVRATLVDKGQHANLEGFEQPKSILSGQGMIFLPIHKHRWQEKPVQEVTVAQSEEYVKEMYYTGPPTENYAVNLAWFRSDERGIITEIVDWNQWMFESEVELLRALYSQQLPLSQELKAKAGIQDE